MWYWATVVIVEVADEFDGVVGSLVSVGEGEEDGFVGFASCFGELEVFGKLVRVVGSLLREGVEVLGVLASFAQPDGVEFDDLDATAICAVFGGQMSEDFGGIIFYGKVWDGILACHGVSPKVEDWEDVRIFWRRMGKKASKKSAVFWGEVDGGGGGE